MSIYQKVSQTKIVKKLFWINFPEGCLSLRKFEKNIYVNNYSIFFSINYFYT